jgi:hypothetical protein
MVTPGGGGQWVFARKVRKQKRLFAAMAGTVFIAA